MIRFVLGGEKSGKSDHALELLRRAPAPALFIATGQARDQDFRQQIQKHRVERGPDIAVREVTTWLPEALSEATSTYASVLVDSLDFWLYACSSEGRLQERTQALLDVLAQATSTEIILVSCEVGLGPVAATGEVRRFVRALGQLNRRVATCCQEVVLVVAGRALRLPE